MGVAVVVVESGEGGMGDGDVMVTIFGDAASPVVLPLPLSSAPLDEVRTPASRIVRGEVQVLWLLYTVYDQKSHLAVRFWLSTQTNPRRHSDSWLGDYRFPTVHPGSHLDPRVKRQVQQLVLVCTLTDTLQKAAA